MAPGDPSSARVGASAGPDRADDQDRSGAQIAMVTAAPISRGIASASGEDRRDPGRGQQPERARGALQVVQSG